MLEGMKAVAAIEVPSRYQPRSARDEALQYARTCYDHIAGRLGVAMADALAANGHIILNDDGGEVTDSGREMLTRFGADLTPISRGRRIFCRPCLDWSERRYHLAGHIGAEICRRCLELGWFKRERDTRALRLTAAGRTGLADFFGLRVGEDERSALWDRAMYPVAKVPQSTRPSPRAALGPSDLASIDARKVSCGLCRGWPVIEALPTS
jgi:hypothetical protein